MKTKTLLSLLFGVLLIPIYSLAKPYSIITHSFTEKGCDYFNVIIWDDNGTPGDRSDDEKLASGTLNDCEDKPSMVPSNNSIHNAKSFIISHTEFIEPNCSLYRVRILNDNQEEIALGKIGLCED